MLSPGMHLVSKGKLFYKLNTFIFIEASTNATAFTASDSFQHLPPCEQYALPGIPSIRCKILAFGALHEVCMWFIVQDGVSIPTGVPAC